MMPSVLASERPRSLAVRQIREAQAAVSRGTDRNIRVILALIEDERRRLLATLTRGTEFDQAHKRALLAELDAALIEFQSRATPLFAAHFREQMERTDEALARLARQALGQDAGLVLTGIDPVLLEFAAENSTALVSGVAEQTRRDLSAIFRRGAVGSTDSAAIAAQVEALLAPEGKSAALVEATFRTETNRLTAGAAGARIDRIERDSGLETLKVWIAAIGPRTRSVHRALNGVTIPNGEHFNVFDIRSRHAVPANIADAMRVSWEEAGRTGKPQGIRASGPLDAALPAGQVVRCRCTLGAKFGKRRDA